MTTGENNENNESNAENPNGENNISSSENNISSSENDVSRDVSRDVGSSENDTSSGVSRSASNDANNASKVNKKSNRKKISGVFVIAACAVLFAVLIGAFLTVKFYLPNNKEVPLFKYYTELDGLKLHSVVDGERVQGFNPPVIENGEVYIPIDFIKQYIDPYIFWDQNAGKLVITNEVSVIRMRTADLNYFVNDKPLKLDIPALNKAGVAYLPSKLVKELYGTEFAHAPEYNHVIVNFEGVDRQLYEVVSKKTAMRYEPDKKSPVEAWITYGQKVTYFSQSGEYSKVMLENGLYGYVLTKAIKFNSIKAGARREPLKVLPVLPVAAFGKINMVWDQVATKDASANPDRKMDYMGLDVISPTWFSFDLGKANGDIINIADRGYVERAHAKGLKVWALITDNFDAKVGREILSNTDKREHVIKQLLSFISLYDLDGINIDFESIRKEDAKFYIQFLREIAPHMKMQEVHLSVDMYVPKPFNLYYNRTEVAKAADYIIIMGYDEHYSGSEVSGPVASIGFVDEGIRETLKEAPKEKIILGVPFYVRVWKETLKDGVVKVTSKAYGMDSAYKLFKDKNANFEWNEKTKNYYAEYEEFENGQKVTCKVWLEDEKSLEEKLLLAKRYDLAGVSGWKKGLEKEMVWDVLFKHLKK